MAKRRQNHIVVPLMVFAGLILVGGLTVIETGDSMLLYRFDAPIHDRLFRLRNYLAAQPISSEVALIGIDDYTNDKLGKYGSGSWVTRKPFVDQIKFCREIYKPAILAYDIIFKEIKGESEKAESDINSQQLLDILVSIRKLVNEEIGEINIETLNNISKLTSDQGNLNLALELSASVDDETNQTNTIVAYDCVWPDPTSEDTGRGWSQEAILGTDPYDLSENNGTLMPYLRDVGIPMKFVKNLPDNYLFSNNANIPSTIILDYVKLAFINVPRDEGGVVRRIPLVHGIQYKFDDPETNEEIQRQFFLPSLALLSCLHYWGIDLTKHNADDDFLIDGKPVIEIDWGNHVTVRKPDGHSVQIPIDRNGSFYLDFVGKITDFNSVHFADVGPYKAYEGAKKILYNKIAVIGITSTGASDVGPCPVDDNTPFVHIHLAALSNILTETFTKPTSLRANLLILFVLALVVIPGGILLRPVKFTTYLGWFSAVYFLLVFYFVFSHQYVLPVTGPVLLISVCHLMVMLYDYLSEEREKKKIRKMFSTMVSGDVLKFLEDNPESFSLAGQRAEATMFFSDVAGFTTISEALTPEKLVELLNAYLNPMSEIILESQGFIDKYEGDAIMAEWGVPYPNPNHAKLACWAALDQQVTLAEIRPRLKEEFGVDITVRMGLNSGIVSAGNMGSDRHFSYTVMGDAVNQAARFEPANKDYDTLIIIGESTNELAKDYIESRLLDKLVVKGKTVPIQVYELVAKKGELPSEMKRVLAYYDDALRFHWDRKWDEAIECLTKALSIRPEDGPSLMLRKRIQAYKIKPPADSWDGEHVKTSKD